MQNPEFTLNKDSVPGPNPAQIWITIPRIQKPNWEKALPEKYIILAVEEKAASLGLKVEIETTDTAEKKTITSLVDSGALVNSLNETMQKAAGLTS